MTQKDVIMKMFSIFKTGYTSGNTGCTGEYFTAIIINDDVVNSYAFQAMYTNGQDIRAYLKGEGYKEFYTSSNWGKLTRKDITPNTRGERVTLEMIKGGK